MSVGVAITRSCRLYVSVQATF